MSSGSFPGGASVEVSVFLTTIAYSHSHTRHVWGMAHQVGAESSSGFDHCCVENSIC